MYTDTAIKNRNGIYVQVSAYREHGLKRGMDNIGVKHVEPLVSVSPKERKEALDTHVDYLKRRKPYKKCRRLKKLGW